LADGTTTVVYLTKKWTVGVRWRLSGWGAHFIVSACGRWRP